MSLSQPQVGCCLHHVFGKTRQNKKAKAKSLDFKFEPRKTLMMCAMFWVHRMPVSGHSKEFVFQIMKTRRRRLRQTKICPCRALLATLLIIGFTAPSFATLWRTVLDTAYNSSIMEILMLYRGTSELWFFTDNEWVVLLVLLVWVRFKNIRVVFLASCSLRAPQNEHVPACSRRYRWGALKRHPSCHLSRAELRRRILDTMEPLVIFAKCQVSLRCCCFRWNCAMGRKRVWISNRLSWISLPEDLSRRPASSGWSLRRCRVYAAVGEPPHRERAVGSKMTFEKLRDPCDCGMYIPRSVPPFFTVWLQRVHTRTVFICLFCILYFCIRRK